MPNRTDQPLSKRRRLVHGLIWAGLAASSVAAGLAIGTGYAVYDAASRLPSFEDIKRSPRGTTLRFLANDGTVLHRTGPAYGEWLSYKAIPVTMRQAIIAVEDHRYRSHFGIDPVALARALHLAFANRDTNRRMQGASTITQQVARTIFLSRSYNIRRKIDEVIVALAMERKFTKNQILELYLNRIYFGGGAYGIDAASRRFYGHDATELSLSEAALLAGLPKAPSSYAPTADKEAALGRAGVVLARMRSTGQQTSAPSKPKGLTFAKAHDPQLRTSSRHFVDWISPQVDQLAPGLSGNVDVYTTLSPALQQASLDAIAAHTGQGQQAAMVSLEEGGAIKAMIGGLDYATSTYNRVTQARRQPGSSFKLFVYLAALEAGFRPSSAVYDGPINIRGWTPHNSSGRYSGVIPLRTAFAWSLNTVAARLGQEVGTAKIANIAHRLGISTPVQRSPSMVLGTADVRLLDMARAYATVASLGRSVVPFGISRIEMNGQTVYERLDYEPQQIVSADNAADMVRLMSGTVDYGTGQASNFGRSAAGKTGTTNSGKDGWFIGFSGGIVTGVWMGRDDARPIPGMQGGRGPALSFADYMKVATKDRPDVITLSPLPASTAPSRATKSHDAQTGIPTQKPERPEESSPLPEAAISTPQATQTVADRAPGRSRAIRPTD